MGTTADVFANQFSVAMKMRPDSFIVDGKEAAVVTSDGKMTMVSGCQLTAKQAVDLRQWIKKNFMEAAS